MDNSKKPLKNGNVGSAIFDYEAQRPDELSFKAGELIEIVDNSDSQWWKGRKPGSESEPLLFPSNFIQIR